MEWTTPRMKRQTLVYEDRYQRIYNVDARINGTDREYFVTDTGSRAGIVVVNHESVLLVKQHRLLVEGLSWEIPGGQVDPGETPKCAAIRECLEETGVKCLEAETLIFYHLGLDMAYNPTHIFYSEEINEVFEPKKINTQEVSGSEWVPLERCIDMVFKGEILDSFSVVGLLAYHSMRTSRG